MGYTRKWIRGRALTFGEAADIIAHNPTGVVYHRAWNRPVPIAFLMNWQIRQLRAAAIRGLICEAVPNPNHPTHKEDHNG